MNTRSRWQELQAHLAAATGAFNAGDLVRAKAELDAAFEIDPDFLAAQALRERLTAPRPAAGRTDLPLRELTPPAGPAPVSRSPTLSLSQFEQRVRRRRIERRVSAARLAINERRLDAARAAIDEIRELDPACEDLPALDALVAASTQRGPTARPGPWLVAVATFSIVVLGAALLDERGATTLRSFIVPGAAQPIAALEPSRPSRSVEVVTENVAPAEILAGTAQSRPASAPPAAFTPRPAAPPAAVAAEPVPVPSAPQREIQAAPVAMATDSAPSRPFPDTVGTVGAVASPRMPPATVATAPPPAVTTAPPAAAASTPTASIPTAPAVSDETLVRETLQRYRAAYERLDARSAQAVWPAVDERALARAFDGLESQRLTFERCDVRLRGESAAATCRGAAEYVPKFGSGDRRVEPRVWTFALSRVGREWQIDSARAQR